MRLSGSWKLRAPISTLIFKNRLGQGSQSYGTLHCARPPLLPPFFVTAAHTPSPGGSQTQIFLRLQLMGVVTQSPFQAKLPLGPQFTQQPKSQGNAWWGPWDFWWSLGGLLGAGGWLASLWLLGPARTERACCRRLAAAPSPSPGSQSAASGAGSSVQASAVVGKRRVSQPQNPAPVHSRSLSPWGQAIFRQEGTRV